MIRFSDALRNGKGLLVIGLLVALLTACGGDDGGGGPAPADPPTGDNGNDDGNDDGSGDDNDDDGAGDGNDDGTNDDQPPFATFQAASLVIGQPDMAAGDPNQGGAGPDANTLNFAVSGVKYSSGSDVMFIADAANSRVLGYAGIPDMNNAVADFVLGQPDFTTAEQQISATGMFSPEFVTTAGGRLGITDTDLNRVTFYENVPTSGDAVPTLVLGQATLDTFSGGCTQTNLVHPHAHFLSPDGKVLVADAGNNRVLVWNEMPAENGAPADLVLGQIDFINCSNGEPENFRHPASLWTDGTRLIVADSEKHRVLIWNTFPTESFQAPDVILGQADREHVTANDDNQDGVTDGLGEGEVLDVENGTVNGNATARTLNYPRDIAVADGRLYVADLNNHRVLVWNSIPAESFTPADVVIGQENMTSNEVNAGEAAPNEFGFQQPIGVNVIGNQLFVTDWKNSRVMVFDAQAEAAAE